MALISNRKHSPVPTSLEQELLESHRSRLASSEHYEVSEIDNVSNFKFRLIPEGLLLKEEQLDDLRSLASLSRIQLTEPSRITSHRPVLGKAIVFVKKLTRPLILAHLKGTVEAMEEFSSRLVASHAKALSRINELEEKNKH